MSLQKCSYINFIYAVIVILSSSPPSLSSSSSSILWLGNQQHSCQCWESLSHWGSLPFNSPCLVPGLDLQQTFLPILKPASICLILVSCRCKRATCGEAGHVGASDSEEVGKEGVKTVWKHTALNTASITEKWKARAVFYDTNHIEARLGVTHL